VKKTSINRKIQKKEEPMDTKKPAFSKQVIIICVVLAVMLIGTVMAFQKAYSGKNAGGSAVPTISNAPSDTTLPIASASADVSVSGTPPPSASPSPTATPAPTLPGTPVIDISNEPEKPVAEHPLRLFWSSDYGVILGGETSPIFIEGKFGVDSYDTFVTRSDDHSAAAFIVNMDSTQYVGDLWYSDGIDAKEIAQNVNPNMYRLSKDGSTVAYMTVDNFATYDMSLYTYDNDTGLTTLITKHAYQVYALSPDGDSVAYTNYPDASNPNAVLGYYSIDGGEPQALGENCYTAALMDHGEIVYYFKYDDSGATFCALHDGEITEYSSALYENWDIIFNEDGSQILYSTSTGGTYFSQTGGSPVKVFNSNLSGIVGQMLVGDGPVLFNEYSSVSYMSGMNASMSIQYSDHYNLCNVLFGTSLAAVYFDEYLQAYTVNSTDYSGKISEEGHAYAYLDNNMEGSSLMYVHDYLLSGTGSEEDAINLGDNAYLYWVAPDTSVYYVDYAGNLNVYRYPGKTTILAGNVRDLKGVTNGDESCLYYMTDTGLYFLTTQTDAKPYPIAQGVDNFLAGDFGVIYLLSDPELGRSGLYYSADGKKSDWIMSFHLIASTTYGG